MNLYLMIAIIIINAIAIGIEYQLIKKLEKKQKLIIIAISVALMYMLVSLIYWISGFGINKEIHEQTKSFIIYLFVPVNMLIFVPYLTIQYKKVRAKEISTEKFSKKIVWVVIVLIIVVVVEYFYFRNVQNNIQTIGNNVENNTIQNQID